MKFFSRRTKLFIIGIFIVCGIVFLANYFSAEIKPFFYNISSPVQKFFWQIGDNCSNFLGAIVWVNDLKKEKDNVCLKNQELLFKIASLEELEEENEVLKAALGVELHKDFELTIAQIIGKDISQDSILLDKGSVCGIKKDMPVITAEKVLVGRISEVYDNYSKAILISSKESSFDARIKEKNISGIVRGKGNSEIFFDLIPQDGEVSQNDIIVSSSLAGFFPSNLLVGQVTKVIRNDVDAFQQAEVSQAFNIKDANYFFIITSRR